MLSLHGNFPFANVGFPCEEPAISGVLAPCKHVFESHACHDCQNR